MLILEFEVQEIKLAIWSCNNSKCTGLNGFNFCFFREFWEVVKDDIVEIF